jgi:hypothetical protein
MRLGESCPTYVSNLYCIIRWGNASNFEIVENCCYNCMETLDENFSATIQLPVCPTIGMHEWSIEKYFPIILFQCSNIDNDTLDGNFFPVGYLLGKHY